MSSPGSRFIVALDFHDPESALQWVEHLQPSLCRLKVGKELFVRAGPALIEKLRSKNFDVFLDLKFHDIPHTVAAACRAAANLGVWMINLHALGGKRMLMAAREALAGVTDTDSNPLLVAVTVLTSLDQEDLREMGMQGSPREWVIRLTQLAQTCDLDGVVCSAHEVPLLRQMVSPSFCLVTPGIRFPDTPTDDQRRVVTPRQALQAGADYLVMGRAILTARDPRMLLETLNAENTPG